MIGTETKIVTIPTELSPIYPDNNGRVFHRETLDAVFRKHGYLRPNPTDRITVTPIPVRFFINVNHYKFTMLETWSFGRHVLNTKEFRVNSDVSDKELKALQVMYVNDRYYVNIPMRKETYNKHAAYFSKCWVHAICTDLRAVDGKQMGMEDILYFDIFPEEY